MRLIMMGTGPFAVPTFERLYETPHTIAALVTRPPRPLHGKSQAEANPMRELAAHRGTMVIEPENINSDEARAELVRLNPDLLVVCDYGQILAPATLSVARLGGINLHGSILPRYRGAAPINWAIYNGDIETGVTVIHMTPRVDAGPAIAQTKLPIGPDETASDLEPRLAALGAPLVVRAIDELAAGRAQAIPQDPAAATRAPRLKKSDGQVDWTRSAEQIKNQVRALNVWPKTYTFWLRGGGEPLRVILERVQAEPSASGATPGTVSEAHGKRLVIFAGRGQVYLESLQPAGKRVLTAGDFLRGYPVRPGHHFGEFGP